MAKLIMVVNDTEEILDLFRELLTSEGYDVSLHAMGSGRSATSSRLRRT